MKDIVVVNAFSNKPEGGNPAAVCFLREPRDDEWMQATAHELNFAETAFIDLTAGHASEGLGLRWFTPVCEVDLCGHATLAAAFAIWDKGLANEVGILFRTKSGLLTARRTNAGIVLDFPLLPEHEIAAIKLISKGLGVPILYYGKSKSDLLVQIESTDVLKSLKPDFECLSQVDARGLIVTCRGPSESPYDFMSRFFAPRVGIDEDFVTGSAHCVLASFWQKKLDRDEFFAYQASSRGGEVRVKIQHDRVLLGGEACYGSQS